MTTLEKDVLALIQEDARSTPEKIGAMLSISPATVKKTIRDLEERGIIVKYTAITNAEKADDTIVEALIEVKVSPKKKEGFDGIAGQIASFPEVKSVYLMSGAYDLAVMLEAKNLLQISRFVSEKISTFDGVISTATHFILKKYKIEGTCTEAEEADNRISVLP